MMLNNLLIISLGKIGLLWLIMYLLIVCINYIRNKHKTSLSKEELKKSLILTRVYLDQFYISNKFYTFFNTSLYIFSTIIIFILLRYASVGYITYILPMEHLSKSLLQVIIIYVIFIITIILYRTLLIMLFKKEVNKFYLYLCQYHWFDQLNNMLTFKLGDYIFGRLRLIFYRIATSTYKEDMYPLDIFGDIHYIFNGEYDYVIQNKQVIIWTYKAQDMASKYLIIQKFFRVFAYIFRFIHKHISNTYELLPYFILITIFITDLYNKEFKNIYLISFVFILLKTKYDFITFIKARRGSIDLRLSYYFYQNEINYNKQRIHFSTSNVITDKIPNSNKNTSLFHYHQDIIDYTFNDFNSGYMIKQSQKDLGIYRRFFIIIAFISLGYFLLSKCNIQVNTIPTILLLTPSILMLYCHYKTYTEFVPEEESLGDEEYKYSFIHNIIFWIATLIQGYIYWLLILKPELIFMNTEILLEMPYDILKIIKIYTIDEKIMYLYQYFEYYITIHVSSDIDKDYLRYMIRQIDYQQLIDSEVTLKDIQIYIKLLLDTYQLNEIFQDIILKTLIETLQDNRNPWYILLRNVILIGAITSTLIHIKNIFLIIKQLTTPYGTQTLMKDIYMTTFHNKITYVKAYELLINMLEKLKHFF